MVAIASALVPPGAADVADAVDAAVARNAPAVATSATEKEKLIPLTEDELAREHPQFSLDPQENLPQLLEQPFAVQI